MDGLRTVRDTNANRCENLVLSIGRMPVPIRLLLLTDYSLQFLLWFARTKIVQGEGNGKKKRRFLFTLLSRSLSYEKIVQGECRTKGKAIGFSFFMLSRSQYFQK